MQVLKDDIRLAILDSALTEFSTKSYERATMSSIASRCKISKSNLYRYYESKESIYHALTAPVMTEIRRAATYMTSKELLIYSNDEIAKQLTEKLFPTVERYRKELLVIMNTTLPNQEQSLQEEVIEYMLKCFFTFDETKMPRNFAYTLASMVMNGICSIITECDSNEEIYEQLLALFRYHSRGVCAFSKTRT